MRQTNPQLPRLHSAAELTALVEEIGFLPLFPTGLPGFSVAELTEQQPWWSGDPAADPWEWRMQIAAQGQLAYAKLFRHKAGFVSREMYPHLVNFRRGSYDFSGRWEDGLASQKEKRLIDAIESQGPLPTFRLKREAWHSGDPGFDGCLNSLQMQTYLTISDFTRKRNRAGAPYGWHIAVFTTPEQLFGETLVDAAYNDAPRDSLGRLLTRAAVYNPQATEAELRRFFRL